MSEAFICDAARTPIGRYAGALSAVRADDLGAIPLRALLERNTKVDWTRVDDVLMGCANQAGEDNRNVARMSLLLAGLPVGIPGATINRLCGSGMDAVGTAARAIKAGEAELLIAGGVESMSRAPFVMGKASAAFSRGAELQDTTMGWRFINPSLQKAYGTETMPETAENVAERFAISREDQDAFALRSQQRAVLAQDNGRLAAEIVPVSIAQRRGDPIIVERDEHPRAGTTLEGLQKLPTPFREGGTVTAGNASGINDGACALLLASGKMALEQGLEPRARVVGMAVSALQPSIMGYGPVDAVTKVLQRSGLGIEAMDVIELNEAFAAQALAVTRALGLADDAEHVNPNGGAIALGHPLGMSGARLVLTATEELQRRQGRYALCAMCIGVGQGIAVLLERV
ncbi:MAG: acetyl-CoA acyltransferase [Glaciecola sp.]|jgi:acetyl-CoA acyltransferase|uniref:3-oxoadipyl-CoA thiolase n=1 Tax=Congregibacter sp. TaxID=2744308 RepID=UPI0039E498E1